MSDNMRFNGKEVVAWHWLDDSTMMVLTEDMEWFRLNNVYVQSIKFEGLDYTQDDSLTIQMPIVIYKPSLPVID